MTDRYRENATAACLTVGIAAFLVYLAGLGGFHLLDVDEPRFATASRNMIARGDWIVPWFNGAVRYDKPILIYWLQAGAMLLLGATEVAARLPSAFGIALGAAATTGIGMRIGLPAATSMLAGGILATAPIAIAIGHGATADGLMLGLTTSTCWLLFTMAEQRPLVRQSIGLGSLLGACFLVKGPPALVAPLALWIGLTMTGRGPRWRDGFLATFVATALVLAWGIPALVLTDGGFWNEGIGHHVIDRSTRGFEGHGGHQWYWYGFYFLVIPAAFLPWTAFAGTTIRAWREPHHSGLAPEDRRALTIWFGLVFAVFTIATSKLAHYPLPAFPVLALFTALGIMEAPRTAPSRLGAAVLAALAVLLGVGPIAFFLGSELVLTQAVVWAAVIGSTGLWFAAARLWRGSVRSAAWIALTGVTAFCVFLSAFALPDFTRQTVAAHIHTIAADIAPERELVLLQLTMPTASFYLERDVPRVRHTADASAEQNAVKKLLDGAVVLARGKRIANLEAAADAVDDPNDRARLLRAVRNPKARVEAYLPSKGKQVEIVRVEL